ncbi:AAA domain-containing protein [Bradyrhizobium ivorense]|uniref:AAA domain-containing protein n=1 Tax=Bradyrhizobium ivorense TaxID=2511166 RepID=UPI0010B54CDA|nr:AAA domain-containing protein [Bradyrhizobium ivorense]VIO79127.1 ATP-dependent RecD-like DNA helicase [Bradyrhizobium ivorense]
MDIRNQGQGVHAREIHGLGQLRHLPKEWYAYTNLEVAIGPGQYREIDAVMVIEDRVLLVDLKDWKHRITCGDGRWYHGDLDMGSPVAKIRFAARKVLEAFRAHLREHNAKHSGATAKLRAPLLQGVVVQCGPASLEEIVNNEKSSAFMLDDFMRFIVAADTRAASLGAPQHVDRRNPLTAPGSPWRSFFATFFNASDGPFRPGRRRYGPYRALSDKPTFAHRAAAYQEFDVEDENVSASTGLLRRWDFSKLDARFQTETGRNEIAGREREVIAYLNDRNPHIGGMILQPKVDDGERGIGYWEVFETRRRLKRLSDFAATEARHLAKIERLELVRQFLAKVKAIHDQDTAHLDIGSHSVWIEPPTLVRLSHLLAARIDDVESLGERRYAFLSCGMVPDEVNGGATHPRSKDCFLAGVVAHQIVFDVAPSAPTSDAPPQWDRAVDKDDSFHAIHAWFEKALSWTGSERFADAAAMLDAFNAAASAALPSDQTLARLERYRLWKTQRQLSADLPSERDISGNDFSESWMSRHEGAPVFVKMWKSSAWGGRQSELSRILDFLERADYLRISPPPGCAQIRKVAWMPDAIVVLREWIDHPTLQETIAGRTGLLASAEGGLSLIGKLCRLVVDLHQSGFAHGDLKPANILVPDDPEKAPVLIDFLEFSTEADGDVVSAGYAPASGGDRFSRDRFALSKIAEEVFVVCEIGGTNAVALTKAIRDCREGPPANATLLPLSECIHRILAPKVEAPKPTVSLSIKNAAPGRLLPDEGIFGLRFGRGGPILLIRGASEEIGIKLSSQCRPVTAWRKTLSQQQIAKYSRHEFARLEIELNVVSSTRNDFGDLREILDDARFQEAWRTRSSELIAEAVAAEGQEADNLEAQESVGGDEGGDLAEDALATEIVSEASAGQVDVPVLWQSLLSAEEDFSVEGTTANDSVYRRETGRHVAAFELEQGELNFDREDKVFVERFDRRRDEWREVGLLDIERSRRTAIAIDASRRFPDARDGLIPDETKLRFLSHWETTSRSRREAASDRILRRQSVVPDLIETFDVRSLSVPSVSDTIVTAAEVKATYGLNDTQANAFEYLTRVQPVGLLQGPPGTGKTKFIAALVHFALSNNLVRNVLLASQSNDAVDNAAEAVLTLFGPNARPAIVRVGQEGSISDRLLPYHAARVETGYKQKLHADLKNRMRVAARNLGISAPASDQLLHIHQSVRPVWLRYCDLIEATADGTEDKRSAGLRRTIVRMAGKIGATESEVEAAMRDRRLVDALTQHVVSGHSIGNLDIAERFASIFNLTADLIGAVSTPERSFESFLAGTRQIVAGTCVGLGRTSLGLRKTPFDLVVVDEAARCTSSELAVPIQSGRWIVLVGDQAQLEPHHRPEVISEVAAATGLPKREIVRSDFERIFASRYGQEAGRKLTQQHRMLAPIGRMVSASFYGGELTHERTDPVIPPKHLPKILDRAVTWIATDNLRADSFQDPDPAGGPSLVNKVEADAIITLLRLWDADRSFRPYLDRTAGSTIGIICTYAAQRDLVRHRFRLSGLSETMKSSVTVGTVDSYQGKQNPIVVLSLVRNNDSGPEEFRRRTITQGFMIRSNRINVALSRAMDRLVIVGARTRWPVDGPMHRVAQAFERELSLNSARLVDVSRLDKGNASPPPSRPQGPKGGRHLRGRKR